MAYGEEVLLGCFVYMWYGYPTGGWGTTHWGDNCEDHVRLKPKLGYYYSGDADVIDQHIQWLEDASVNFAILSCFYTGDPFAPDYTYDVAQLWRDALPVDLNFCIMAEGHNSDHPFGVAQADYIWTNFAQHARYQKWKEGGVERPLIIVPGTGTYTDARFWIRYLTAEGKRDECVWAYVPGAPANNGLAETAYDYDGNIAEQHEACTIVVGFDDRARYKQGAYKSITYRPKSLQRYSDDWLTAGRVGTRAVLLTSFNEWHEESCLEPCDPQEIHGWGEEYIQATKFHSGESKQGA